MVLLLVCSTNVFACIDGETKVGFVCDAGQWWSSPAECGPADYRLDMYCDVYGKWQPGSPNDSDTGGSTDVEEDQTEDEDPEYYEYYVATLLDPWTIPYLLSLCGENGYLTFDYGYPVCEYYEEYVVDDSPGYPDSDGDGASDYTDNCPGVENSDQEDSDGDGSGDACDNCPFANGAPTRDRDYDGIGDACDFCGYVMDTDNLESDGDYVGDVCDNCPNTYNTDQRDSDFNGIGDACDNCIFVENPDQGDNNKNGVGDVCE